MRFRRLSSFLEKQNTTFTEVVKYEFAQNKAEFAVIKLPKSSARYVKLSAPDHHEPVVSYPNIFVFLTEVEVYTVCQKFVRISIPPEAFDCCGSHPQLFGFVMEIRSKLGAACPYGKNLNRQGREVRQGGIVFEFFTFLTWRSWR